MMELRLLPLALVATLGCHRGAAADDLASGPLEADRLERRLLGSETRRVVIPARHDELPLDSLPRIAPRVAAVAAEPGVLRLQVGDTLWFGESIRVAAVDSSGERIGWLPIFDHGTRTGVARFVHDESRGTGLTGRQPGTDSLHVSFPRYAWSATASGGPPSVVVLVSVAASR